MKFNPQKIENNFISFFKNEQGLTLGQIISFAETDFIKFMDLWVSVMDSYIAKAPKYKEIYIELFSHRAFTYDEYLELFVNIDEKHYKYHSAYEYFTIIDKYNLGLIRTKNEASKAGYVKCIHSEFEKGKLQGLYTILNKSFDATIAKESLNIHAYLSGASGTGKSELMKLIIYQLANENNSSIVLIDPHGDLAKECLAILSEKHIERIEYIDPFFKTDYSPVINPFSIDEPTPQNVDITAQALSDAICELFPSNELSINMKTLLVPCISVLLYKKDSNLTDLQQLIKGDKTLLEYAKQHSGHHSLFFDNFDDVFTTTKNALFIKLQHLLNSLIFSQCTIGKSSFDIKKSINSNKIIICNLNKGNMGNEYTQAFGKFIIAMIRSSVMIREKNRNQTYLFIDEAQNFIAESISTIATEARKFKLSLILSNQMSAQFGSIEDSILSNVNLLLTGANKHKDATKKISSIANISNEQLQNIKKYHFHYFNKTGKSYTFQVSSQLVDKFPALKPEFCEFLVRNYQKNEIPKNISPQEEETRPKAKFKL